MNFAHRVSMAPSVAWKTTADRGLRSADVPRLATMAYGPDHMLYISLGLRWDDSRFFILPDPTGSDSFPA